MVKTHKCEIHLVSLMTKYAFVQKLFQQEQCFPPPKKKVRNFNVKVANFIVRISI